MGSQGFTKSIEEVLGNYNQPLGDKPSKFIAAKRGGPLMKHQCWLSYSLYIKHLSYGGCCYRYRGEWESHRFLVWENISQSVILESSIAELSYVYVITWAPSRLLNKNFGWLGSEICILTFFPAIFMHSNVLEPLLLHFLSLSEATKQTKKLPWYAA